MNEKKEARLYFSTRTTKIANVFYNDMLYQTRSLQEHDNLDFYILIACEDAITDIEEREKALIMTVTNFSENDICNDENYFFDKIEKVTIDEEEVSVRTDKIR